MLSWVLKYIDLQSVLPKSSDTVNNPFFLVFLRNGTSLTNKISCWLGLLVEFSSGSTISIFGAFTAHLMADVTLSYSQKEWVGQNL